MLNFKNNALPLIVAIALGLSGASDELRGGMDPSALIDVPAGGSFLRN